MASLKSEYTLDHKIQAIVDRYPNLYLQINKGERHRIMHRPISPGSLGIGASRQESMAFWPTAISDQSFMTCSITMSTPQLAPMTTHMSSDAKLSTPMRWQNHQVSRWLVRTHAIYAHHNRYTPMAPALVDALVSHAIISWHVISLITVAMQRIRRSPFTAHDTVVGAMGGSDVTSTVHA